MTNAAYKKNYDNIDFSDLQGCTRINHSTEETGKRSNLSAPIIIGDNIDVKSMADGKQYTSKRALRKSYREQGFVEMGNERPKRKKPKRKPIRESVEKAFAQSNR